MLGCWVFVLVSGFVCGLCLLGFIRFVWDVLGFGVSCFQFVLCSCFYKLNIGFICLLLCFYIVVIDLYWCVCVFIGSYLCLLIFLGLNVFYLFFYVFSCVYLIVLVCICFLYVLV